MKRATAVSGAVVLSGLVLLSVGWVISGSWINPFEKEAMRACLPDIEKIRKFQGVDSPEYSDQVEKTKADLAVCRKRAFTSYDHQLIAALELDFDGAIREQKIWQLPDSSPVKEKMLESIAKVDEFSDSSLRNNIK
jgi:hypothetical protein